MCLIVKVYLFPVLHLLIKYLVAKLRTNRNVHQDVEVSQKDLFDATVERMVRQHQGNPLCAVSYHVGVLDGITPTDT